MKLKELQQYLTDRGLKDTWWLSVDGIVQEEPIRLSHLVIRRKQFDGKLIELLHTRMTYQEDPDWFTFDYGSSLSLRLDTANPFKLKTNSADSSYSRNVAVYRSSASFNTRSTRLAHSALETKLPRKEEHAQREHSADKDIAFIYSELMLKNKELEKAKIRLDEQQLALLEKERELMRRERKLAIEKDELREREIYTQSAENDLIQKCYDHDETKAEIEQMMADFETNQNKR